MAKIKNKHRIGQQFKNKLRPRREEAAMQVTADVMDDVLTQFPVENGHAHLAWLTALEQLPQHDQISDVISKHYHKKSKFPEAADYGSGRKIHKRNFTLVQIFNSLPFVKTMEEGGVIEPINPKGKKAPNTTEGRLYGQRTSSGIGWLKVGSRFLRRRIVYAFSIVERALGRYR